MASFASSSDLRSACAIPPGALARASPADRRRNSTCPAGGAGQRAVPNLSPAGPIAGIAALSPAPSLLRICRSTCDRHLQRDRTDLRETTRSVTPTAKARSSRRCWRGFTQARSAGRPRAFGPWKWLVSGSADAGGNPRRGGLRSTPPQRLLRPPRAKQPARHWPARPSTPAHGHQLFAFLLRFAHGTAIRAGCAAAPRGIVVDSTCDFDQPIHRAIATHSRVTADRRTATSALLPSTKPSLARGYRSPSRWLNAHGYAPTPSWHCRPTELAQTVSPAQPPAWQKAVT